MTTVQGLNCQPISNENSVMAVSTVVVISFSNILLKLVFRKKVHPQAYSVFFYLQEPQVLYDAYKVALKLGLRILLQMFKNEKGTTKLNTLT